MEIQHTGIGIHVNELAEQNPWKYVLDVSKGSPTPLGQFRRLRRYHPRGRA